MDEEESGKTLGEYLALLRRRKGQILAVAAALAAVAVVLAIGLPAMYRSSATILVQEQEVPSDLVRSTITSFADERIQVISQQVMTRAVLLQLVDKYGLYGADRKRLSSDEILERMRKDIKLTTVNADISDRSSGRRVNATIAFTISYDSPQADRAQKVVNELVSQYLNENAKVRQQSVAETASFLGQEADRLARQIQDIETNLAQFKRRNAGRLPDSSAINMQLAERTGAELSRIEREISALQERELSLETQLANVSPNSTPPIGSAGERILTPAERLRALKAQYSGGLAMYKAEHPDMRRMQREIAELSVEVSAPGQGADAADRLGKREAEASQGKTTGASVAADKLPGSEPIQRSDNPAYIALAAQIQGTKRELNKLAALREDLRAQQRTYDARLQQIPEVEREYQDLTRDYSNAQTRYREVKAKQMQAEVSQELERDRKAERFSLGEPANLPERPFSPNRPVIALVGMLAALGGGIGLAGLREAVDSSIKGPLELARIASAPILTPIPYIETRSERVGKRRRMWLTACIVFILVTVFLLGIHFFLKPLPVLLEPLSRRIAS